MDLVDIARLRRALDRHPGLAPRTFTAAELARAAEVSESRRAQFLSGRFATKEAVLKALGVGLSGGVSLTDIETDRSESGAPVLRLLGEARRLAEEGGLTRFQTTISHDAGVAAAVVLLT